MGSYQLKLKFEKKLARSSASYAIQPTNDASDVQSTIYGGRVTIVINHVTSNLASKFAGPPIKPPVSTAVT